MAGEKVEDTGAGPNTEAAEPPSQDRIADLANQDKEWACRNAALTMEVGADCLVRDLPHDVPPEIQALALQVRRNVYRLSRHFAPDLPPIAELESGDEA